MVQELSDKQFGEITAKDIPVIVDFWASWCGPCRMMAPVFDEVSKEYAGRLAFAKLNTEVYPDVAANSQVTGIPCLIIYKNGEEVDRIVGFAPKPLLKQKIDAILARV